MKAELEKIQAALRKYPQLTYQNVEDNITEPLRQAVKLMNIQNTDDLKWLSINEDEKPNYTISDADKKIIVEKLIIIHGNLAGRSEKSPITILFQQLREAMRNMRGLTKYTDVMSKTTQHMFLFSMLFFGVIFYLIFHSYYMKTAGNTIVMAAVVVIIGIFVATWYGWFASAIWL